MISHLFMSTSSDAIFFQSRRAMGWKTSRHFRYQDIISHEPPTPPKTSFSRSKEIPIVGDPKITKRIKNNLTSQRFPRASDRNVELLQPSLYTKCQCRSGILGSSGRWADVASIVDISEISDGRTNENSSLSVRVSKGSIVSNDIEVDQCSLQHEFVQRKDSRQVLLSAHLEHYGRPSNDQRRPFL